MPKGSYRESDAFANDSSLGDRLERSVLRLMRAKGKFAQRLVGLSLDLGQLRVADFTEELVPAFEELLSLIEKYRTDIPVQFGHFSAPSPKDRDLIVGLLLQLHQGYIRAEERAG